ncbi:electron transport complex subunit RsxG [Pasteurella multocida]|uniref:electron transport complex subunit RsxG n=1 Tax=Pasteurella multocida TaxID=747 RepID=UPI001480FC9E|nr:electron transport complex subunit RsxG [Pasteurella multocida]NNI72707.1 electron transport complex subunit RsxG [Pasteurella multocida]
MKTVKISAYYAILLALIALICTALSTGIYLLTKSKIEDEINKQQQALLLEVVPQAYFDNPLSENCQRPNSEKLRAQRIDRLCIATKNNQKTAYAFETVAPDGYAGRIRLLVGITPTGTILGVRVLEHQETPGLGDKIETRISDWILSFSQQQLRSDNLADWAVKKDGGKFDQFAGATITPRAVVNQVKQSALSLLDELNREN